MNGSTAVWQAHTAPDGRAYYYNSQTKVTTWVKPPEITTEYDRVLGSSGWKEYTDKASQRKYWHNAASNQTTWNIPPELQNLQGAPVAEAPKPQPAPAFVAGGVQPKYDKYPSRDGREGDDYISLKTPDTAEPRNAGRQYVRDPERIRTSTSLAVTSESKYSEVEAEAIFAKVLKRAGVEADWTWQQAMRAAVKDPQYHALQTARERQAAFFKYVAELRSQEKEKEIERQKKLRVDFTTMLRSHPDIKYYTRWKTARPIIEGETIFRSARSEDEALALFNEYRHELQKKHIEDEKSNRQSALAELQHILGALDLSPYTKWSSVSGAVMDSDRFKSDAKFKSITKLDVLKAFESHIMSLSTAFESKKQQEKNANHRHERKNRDGFVQLLRDLQRSGTLRADSKWEDIVKLIDDDPRYQAMLGQPGSQPHELFFDALEISERELKGKKNDVLDMLEAKRFEITLKTTFDELQQLAKTDPKTANIEPATLKIIFDRLREKILNRRDNRRTIDALRSRIKHLDPPVKLSDTWDEVRPRLEKYEEYKALEVDELRIQAYDKYIRRLKEREVEEREQKRRERSREDRARDRDHRNGHRRHTRSPEYDNDPYAADRKKAQADRERNYRKGSSVMGLSPPPGSSRRDRRPDDYYHDDPRDLRSRHPSSHYERERREREVERERTYISRADPRDRVSSLDYGDERPLNIRRRRDSDADSKDSGRDSKRARRERSSYSPRGARRSKTPKVEPPKEDEGLKSGSEEGEIEEI